MEEKTYTKGDLMAALNAMKEPSDSERAKGSILSDTDPFKFAIVGAEVLIGALEGGENPRERMTDRIGRICLVSILEQESPKLARIFSDALMVSDDAERITTPPRGE